MASARGERETGGSVGPAGSWRPRSFRAQDIRFAGRAPFAAHPPGPPSRPPSRSLPGWPDFKRPAFKWPDLCRPGLRRPDLCWPAPKTGPAQRASVENVSQDRMSPVR